MVWYTGQFYALFFLEQALKVDGFTANLLIAWSLLLGTGGFILFGWLSDKIGRKPIILGGCLIAALTYFPLFKAADARRQPGALPGAGRRSRSRSPPTGELLVPVQPGRHGQVHQLLRHREGGCWPAPAVNYTVEDAPAGTVASVQIGAPHRGVDAATAGRTPRPAGRVHRGLGEALTAAGYPGGRRSLGRQDVAPFDIFREQPAVLIGILTSSSST